MHTQQRERPYHHGNLRRALMEAALELATERGINDFTLREVARQAGVSHAAPYHHFADKAALIEALAIEGYEKLRAALQSAHDATPGNALAKLLAVGVAYVQFAVEHSAQFHFMNWPQLRQTPATTDTPYQLWSLHGELDQAVNASYQVLERSIVECQQAHLINDQTSPAALALTAWCTVHGLSMLLIDTPASANSTVLAETVLRNLTL